MKKLFIENLHEKTEEAIIDHMKNAKNNRLESEEELAKMLGVSRTTVREAMNYLVRKGLLTKRKGKGNFFLKSALNTPMRIDLFGDFDKLIRQGGYEPKKIRTFSHKSFPNSDTAEKLMITEKDPILHFVWKFMANDKLAINIFMQIPEKYFKIPPTEQTKNKKMNQKDVFKEYCNIDISHVIAFIAPTKNTNICLEFGLDNCDSINAFQQYYYDLHDRCVAFSDIYINSNLIKLSIVTKW